MLEVGAVLYLYNRDITPPDKKYSVCVQVSKGYFFLINTENRKMYECMPIKQKDNTYLKYDSYISCSNYFTYNMADLNYKNIVGHLGYKDLKALYLHIKNNVRNLNPKVKAEILQSLKETLEDYE